jgi:hypothetical protein
VDYDEATCKSDVEVLTLKEWLKDRYNIVKNNIISKYEDVVKKWLFYRKNEIYIKPKKEEKIINIC